MNVSRVNFGLDGHVVGYGDEVGSTRKCSSVAGDEPRPPEFRPKLILYATSIESVLRNAIPMERTLLSEVKGLI